MIARFMRDTPLEEVEIEMQLVPGFAPRACGTIRLQQNATEPCSSPFEALLELIRKEAGLQAFTARVQKIMETESNPQRSKRNRMPYRNAGHKKRFQDICQSGLFPKMNGSHGYAAAIFLLTADDFVWSRAVSHIHSGRIHFGAVRIRGVDLDGYAIFQMAKELYSGRAYITISELCDPDLINDRLLYLILHAFLVRRHGTDILKEGW